jgi:hypothetical protein
MKKEQQQILIRDYTYYLPTERIAKFPLRSVTSRNYCCTKMAA